jgi:hypothetical protein
VQVVQQNSSQRAEAEQRIRDCGQTTIHLTGLSDAEMGQYADSVEAAKDRRSKGHAFDHFRQRC